MYGEFSIVRVRHIIGHASFFNMLYLVCNIDSHAQVTPSLLKERLKSLCLQRIELLLGDYRVVNKALQDLGAESLAVINCKIKRAALSRCLALHVKRGVRERKPRSDFN